MKISEPITLEFEPLNEKHLTRIMPIEIEAYPESWSVGMFREEIRNNNSYFFVALINSTVIGYAGFWLMADEAHITSLTVKDLYRGNGFGHQQLNHLLTVAAGRGAKWATLEVRESNRYAYDLYKSFDFEKAGRRKGYYTKTGEDAILMTKDLRDGEFARAATPSPRP